MDAAALVLDPLLSRLDVKLDSHKDQQVRLALEPLVAVADRTQIAQFGLIHVNKSATNDPLSSLMASRAFAAVARSVLFIMTDPNDEDTRLLGTPKNNLGRSDLPTLTFNINGVKVAETDEGDIWTGKLVWTGQTTKTIREALEAVAETSGDRTATEEAADWLQDYLASEGGAAESAAVKKAGAAAGHSVDAIKRARQRLRVTSVAKGFPRKTYWHITSSSVGAPSGETLIAPTAPTAPTESQSVQSVQWETDVTPTPTELSDADDARY